MKGQMLNSNESQHQHDSQMQISCWDSGPNNFNFQNGFVPVFSLWFRCCVVGLFCASSLFPAVFVLLCPTLVLSLLYHIHGNADALFPPFCSVKSRHTANIWGMCPYFSLCVIPDWDFGFSPTYVLGLYLTNNQYWVSYRHIPNLNYNRVQLGN